MSKIPDQKPFGLTKDSWTNEGPKGKLTENQRQRHEEIFGERKPNPGHTTYVYRDGKRIAIPNPSTHGPIIHSPLRRI